LFQRIIDRTGFRALRRHPHVGCVIMARLAQGHGIAKSAGDGKIMPGWTLRQIRQPRPFACQAGAVISEHHFKFVITRDGPHATRQRPPERLCIHNTRRL
jgi:hypothetical protein